ncbi:hypothetical protein BKA81DRAFT_374895 [Phyllosticta paracitricarpa]
MDLDFKDVSFNEVVSICDDATEYHYHNGSSKEGEALDRGQHEDEGQSADEGQPTDRGQLADEDHPADGGAVAKAQKKKNTSTAPIQPKTQDERDEEEHEESDVEEKSHSNFDSDEAEEG